MQTMFKCIRFTFFYTHKSLKATVSFRQDWLGLPCLVQLLTWLHV